MGGGVGGGAKGEGGGKGGGVEQARDLRDRLMAVLPALSRERAMRIASQVRGDRAPDHPRLAGVISFLSRDSGLLPEKVHPNSRLQYLPSSRFKGTTIT